MQKNQHKKINKITIKKQLKNKINKSFFINSLKSYLITSLLNGQKRFKNKEKYFYNINTLTSFKSA